MGGGNSSTPKSTHELTSPIHIEEERIPENRASSHLPEYDHYSHSFGQPLNSNVPEKPTVEHSLEKPTDTNSHHHSSISNSFGKPDAFFLNQLAEPAFISHIKLGSTICSDGHSLLLQDGVTTIELRSPPKFQVKQIPWNYGLIRDISWNTDLRAFIILTKDAVYSATLESPSALPIPTAKPISDFQVKMYKKIKPFTSAKSFWRCTNIGKTLYISYSGFGTVIDEYFLDASSYHFVRRWTPPNTCNVYEGIWCIRYHPEAHELALAIVDARNNQWRLEIRNPGDLTLLWHTLLPLGVGDCEISPLFHGEWLAINSCGIRLIQISDRKVKSGVEYERELKNAICIGRSYFVVRTKTTVEIHRLKSKK